MNQSLRKPLRRSGRSRSEPRDFFRGLPEVAEAKSYRGACHVEQFSDDRGADEYVVVVDPPYDGDTYDLLTEGRDANFYLALVELSEQACPTDDLGDEALGLCYSPDARAVSLTQRFVENFGLLEWGDSARCDCVGDQGRFGRVEERSGLVQQLERMDEINTELSEFPATLEPEHEEELGPTIGSGLRPSALSMALQFLDPKPVSPARRLGSLLREKSRLESSIAEAQEKWHSRNDHFVGDRFSWLHFDFYHAKEKQVEHFNSVSWILQEALSIRRAVRLREAIRRYQVGDKSDAVAALWKKRSGGRLTLFDSVAAPLKPRRQLLVFLSILELRDLVTKHIGRARPQADYVFYPENAAIRDTDFRRSRPKLSFTTNIPLVAAWLQLYDDILSDRSAGRICQECRKVFDPTRTDQAFCSKTCSNRFHQREYRVRNSRKATNGGSR